MAVVTHVDRERGIVTIGPSPNDKPPVECEWWSVAYKHSPMSTRFLRDTEGRLLTYPRYEAQKAMLDLVAAYGDVWLVAAPDGSDSRMLRLEQWV